MDNRYNNTPLTSAQRKLAEENHAFIFYYMKRKGLDQDEFYDILAYALCKAARAYDPTQCAFATFCWSCFENEIGMFRRSQSKRITALPFSYYDTKVDEETQNLIYKTVPDPDAEQRIDETETAILIKDFVKNLPEKLEQTLKLRLQGYSQREIARMVGVNQTMVSRRLAKIREMFNDYKDGNRRL